MLTASRVTAKSRIAPIKKFCQYIFIPIRERIFIISTIIRDPKKVPKMDPSPPLRLAPPIITAVITLSGNYTC